ncbi:nicotinate-nucleotide adenylyltransferase [Methylocystis heyeri]|uniref:Probable nicotinate-nucleotide adenylyltransferase n=1 Tax=Methylocystis heyeri TaxID=391905 RepID=A0A6B8KDG9_9HYPH|nr:nicotinate-nucleotide adenylyltransferase [Methylocystis heyeri]QGM44473.1 nicotinate-nucleotide adenylyltransferase [Methylocystis heyeri]
MTPRLPPHCPGMRIGLFGGSFNPPHEGHLHVSRAALTRLKLHRLWWLVTPGNPLKDTGNLPSLERRMAACRALARDPRIAVTGIEAQIRTRFTYDTLRFLRMRCPGVRFVWIMGADNLLGFHRWRHWRDIIRLAPIAVVDRPGSTWKISGALSTQVLAKSRLPEKDAGVLAKRAPPAFVYLHGKRAAQSSTALRAASRSSCERRIRPSGP